MTNQINLITDESVKAAVVFALDKRTPMDPICEKVGDIPVSVGSGKFMKGTTVYKCPDCGTYLTRTHKYCYACGKAIKWK